MNKIKLRKNNNASEIKLSVTTEKVKGIFVATIRDANGNPLKQRGHKNFSVLSELIRRGGDNLLPPNVKIEKGKTTEYSIWRKEPLLIEE